MEEAKKNVKKAEITVLDRGKNFDAPIIMAVFCCGSVFIPFRW